MNTETETRRRTVLAAVDDSAAARPVITVAQMLAALLSADTEADHVVDGGDAVVQAAVTASGVAYRELHGSEVEAIVERASSDDVVAVVMGAPSAPHLTQPEGRIGLELITRLPVPAIVVPPAVRLDRRLHRMLVPLDGTAMTADTLRGAIELAVDADMEVIALHVLEPPAVPMFTDQPQHERRSWSREFLGRFTTRPRNVRLELRLGTPSEHLLAVAREQDADMLVLGWSQTLEPGHAAVVREAIDRGRVPVMLLPVRPTGQTAEHS